MIAVATTDDFPMLSTGRNVIHIIDSNLPTSAFSFATEHASAIQFLDFSRAAEGTMLVAADDSGYISVHSSRGRAINQYESVFSDQLSGKLELVKWISYSNTLVFSTDDAKVSDIVKVNDKIRFSNFHSHQFLQGTPVLVAVESSSAAHIYYFDVPDEAPCRIDFNLPVSGVESVDVAVRASGKISMIILESVHASHLLIVDISVNVCSEACVCTVDSYIPLQPSVSMSSQLLSVFYTPVSQGLQAFLLTREASENVSLLSVGASLPPQNVGASEGDVFLTLGCSSWKPLEKFEFAPEKIVPFPAGSLNLPSFISRESLLDDAHSSEGHRILSLETLTCYCISSDCRFLAFGYSDGLVLLCDGARLHVVDSFRFSVAKHSVGNGSGLVESASGDDWIDSICADPDESSLSVVGLSFSPSCLLLYVFLSDGRLAIIDVIQDILLELSKPAVSQLFADYIFPCFYLGNDMFDVILPLRFTIESKFTDLQDKNDFARTVHQVAASASKADPKGFDGSKMKPFERFIHFSSDPTAWSFFGHDVQIIFSTINDLCRRTFGPLFKFIHDDYLSFTKWKKYTEESFRLDITGLRDKYSMHHFVSLVLGFCRLAKEYGKKGINILMKDSDLLMLWPLVRWFYMYCRYASLAVRSVASRIRKGERDRIASFHLEYPGLDFLLRSGTNAIHVKQSFEICATVMCILFSVSRVRRIMFKVILESADDKVKEEIAEAIRLFDSDLFKENANVGYRVYASYEDLEIAEFFSLFLCAAMKNVDPTSQRSLDPNDPNSKLSVVSQFYLFNPASFPLRSKAFSPDCDPSLDVFDMSKAAMACRKFFDSLNLRINFRDSLLASCFPEATSSSGVANDILPSSLLPPAEQFDCFTDSVFSLMSAHRKCSRCLRLSSIRLATSGGWWYFHELQTACVFCHGALLYIPSKESN
eukprot:ANDGO_00016.mRNA.2 hypothetical protein